VVITEIRNVWHEKWLLSTATRASNIIWNFIYFVPVLLTTPPVSSITCIITHGAYLLSLDTLTVSSQLAVLLQISKTQFYLICGIILLSNYNEENRENIHNIISSLHRQWTIETAFRFVTVRSHSKSRTLLAAVV